MELLREKLQSKRFEMNTFFLIDPIVIEELTTYSWIIQPLAHSYASYKNLLSDIRSFVKVKPIHTKVMRFN